MRGPEKSSARVGAACLLLSLLVLGGCAETDPYKRLERAETPALSAEQAARAFNTRWPAQFKVVHTVTIDFRVTTRTLVGYLVVQSPGDFRSPGRFRLQGMSEQGIRLFDIADDGQGTRVLHADEEVDSVMLESISRDVRRIFLESWQAGMVSFEDDGAGVPLWKGEVKPSCSGARAVPDDRMRERRIFLMGDPPRTDWYEYRREYRVDHYEWRDQGGFFAPSVIVLREGGSPAYKLTIRITDFEQRDEPWPDAVFAAGDE